MDYDYVYGGDNEICSDIEIDTISHGHLLKLCFIIVILVFRVPNLLLQLME